MIHASCQNLYPADRVCECGLKEEYHTISASKTPVQLWTADNNTETVTASCFGMLCPTHNMSRNKVSNHKHNLGNYVRWNSAIVMRKMCRMPFVCAPMCVYV